jgi:hypothetical protein
MDPASGLEKALLGAYWLLSDFWNNLPDVVTPISTAQFILGPISLLLLALAIRTRFKMR